MRHLSSPALLGTLACALTLLVGCQSKQAKEQARQAQEAATAAEARVNALQKELEAVKQAATSGTDDDKKLSTDQQKALEKLVADAKAKADAKRTEAKQVQEGKTTPKPVPPAPPVFAEIPAETKLHIRLAKALSTESVKAGDAWSGTLASPVEVQGKTPWPEGTPVHGIVTQSTAPGALRSGQGGLGIRLTQVGGHDVDAGTFLVAGGPKGERNAKFIGGGAALGALAGLLSDKNNRRDHALAGAAIGALAGTAAAAGTADKAITLSNEKPVTFSLTTAARVQMK